MRTRELHTSEGSPNLPRRKTRPKLFASLSNEKRASISWSEGTLEYYVDFLVDESLNLID